MLVGQRVRDVVIVVAIVKVVGLLGGSGWYWVMEESTKLN